MNSISKLAMPLKRTAAGKRLSPMILLTVSYTHLTLPTIYSV